MKKNIDKIPKGDYCYEWIEVPSPKNKFRGTTKRCPYWEGIYEDDECISAYCHFLEEEDCICLGDQVKACGLNMYDEDDLPPLTEEQKAEIDKRLADLDRWEKEGTLDQHTISHDDLLRKIKEKYGEIK